MSDHSSWKKAWNLLDAREQRRAYLVLLVVIVAALASAGMVGAVFPFLSVLADPAQIHGVGIYSWAYDRFGFTSDYAFVIALGLLALVIIVAANLIQVVRTYVVNRFALGRIHSLSRRLMAGYLSQPYEYFLSTNSDDLSTRILSEAEHAVNGVLLPAANVIAAFLSILAVVALLMWINPVAATSVFVIVGGVYGLALYLSRRHLARLGDLRVEYNSHRYRLVGEALGGVRDIRLLGRERSYLDRFEEPSRGFMRTRLLSTLIGELPLYAMQTVAYAVIIILCLVLIDPNLHGTAAALGGLLPLLGVFAFAGQRLMPEVSKLYHGLTQLKFGAAGVEALHEDLQKGRGLPPLPAQMAVPLPLTRELRLESVSYAYPGTTVSGLRGISLSVRAGEKIGIVGSSGAGKTTLANLVLGLLAPSSGRLLVDGTPIGPSNLRSWQRSVGYVPQDVFLSDGTIAENIALGTPPEEIDRERVRQSAAWAQIDAFVSQGLPNGYDTPVGERGVRLSGGQRQRVGIARALYHHADLIVFDEATSALDNMTEREVMSAIEALPGNVTVLIIAHRLSTVKRCDRVLVLERAEMVGLGTWDELLESNIAFRRIAEAA